MFAAEVGLSWAVILNLRGRKPVLHGSRDLIVVIAPMQGVVSISVTITCAIGVSSAADEEYWLVLVWSGVRSHVRDSLGVAVDSVLELFFSLMISCRRGECFEGARNADNFEDLSNLYRRLRMALERITYSFDREL